MHQHVLHEVEWRGDQPAAERPPEAVVTLTEFYCLRCEQLFPSREASTQTACLTRAERQRLN